MNIELLAAEIAAAVPELARDSVTNSAERIKGMILSEAQRCSEPANVDKKIESGSDLPEQLEIRHGLLLMKSGKIPTFDIPDGTTVTLMPRKNAVRLVDDSLILFQLGA